MKPTLALLTLALASCTAFTAPRDPVTGIRQDAPVSWSSTPNPLDFPAGGFPDWCPISEGHFGHCWLHR